MLDEPCVDASVIIAGIVNEPEREVLVQTTRGADLLDPPSVHWEVGNAFSAMLKRKRLIVEGARKALEVYRQIPIRFAEVEIEEAWRVASAARMYAYDAYLLCCAEKDKAPLISLDQNLLPVAEKRGLDVVRLEG